MNGINLNEGLLGSIDESTRADLQSFIASLPASQAAALTKVVAKAGSVNSKLSTSKAELISRLHQITDPKIIAGVLSGEILIKDYEVFKAVTINAAASFSKMFAQADNITVGVTNINNGRLDLGMYMLVDRIVFQYGVNATLASTAWGTDIEDVVKNGYINIKQSGRVLVPDYTPCSLFDNKQNAGQVKGELKLDNPFWLLPEEYIEANYTGAAAAAANANVRIAFRGSVLVSR